MTIADYARGVFSYARTATAYDPIIVHLSNNTLVSSSNPAMPGEMIIIYATGIGKLSNAPANDAGAPGGPLAQAVDPPAIAIGGVASETGYLEGLTPGSVGLAQFDVTLQDLGGAGTNLVDSRDDLLLRALILAVMPLR